MLSLTHSGDATCYHLEVQKTVGRRRTDVTDPAALQQTLAAVRGTGRLVPRGVYRFRSFEEADAWMTRMMARTHVSAIDELVRLAQAVITSPGR